MNMRTTKIVAPLVAMALCTPNVAFAQERLNPTIISGHTDVNESVSLTRSIYTINRNNSTSQDSNTIYVNPGDTINVRLDLKGKTDKANHGFTSFKEVVSPIQEFSASSGTRVVKYGYSSEPETTTLDKLDDGTFEKIDKQTIGFKANSKFGFGVVAQRVTINYSYTAANEPGTYLTQFKPDDPKFGSNTFDANDLNLTIVVKGEDEKRPPHEEGERPAPPEQDERPAPPEQDERPAPPEQDEQAIPPKSNRSTVFSWLTKALGVLAFLGGTVWFIIKHIFRL
ncbi:membrane protein [Corynebacterium diphtheriae]|nr:membrane protein [Corynebacterium diphtheriae]CAB0759157.1 membrane protein [Corynebacterium diphtheriae]CAB0759313.1 membrane protein [Corynebacterium diphtheriae]